MQRLKVHGFIVLDYMDCYPEAIAALGGSDAARYAMMAKRVT
jgi:hypothetical protein